MYLPTGSGGREENVTTSVKLKTRGPGSVKKAEIEIMRLWDASPHTQTSAYRACVLSHPVQSTFYDPMDCCPPSSSVHAIFQSRYWSQLPFPPPGDLPGPQIQPTSPTCSELAGRFFITESSGNPPLLKAFSHQFLLIYFYPSFFDQ